MIRLLTTALLAASVSAQAGDWSGPQYDATDHSYLSFTVSRRFNNSMLSIFAAKRFNCQVYASTIDLFDERFPNTDKVPVTIRFRVDGGRIFSESIDAVPQNGDYGKYVSRIVHYVPTGNKDLVNALLGGHRVIVQTDDDETDEYSLNGITAAALGVEAACKKLGQDEWNTGSTSDKGEWEA